MSEADHLFDPGNPFGEHTQHHFDTGYVHGGLFQGGVAEKTTTHEIRLLMLPQGTVEGMSQRLRWSIPNQHIIKELQELLSG